MQPKSRQNVTYQNREQPFSSFVNHPDNFVTFLEACLKEKSLDKRDKADLYIILFEMYLKIVNTKKGEEEFWEAKAKRLIDGEDVCPMLHAECYS